MTLIDFCAVRAAYRFVLDHRATVLAGAGLYAVLFAVQSLFTAYAGAYAPGAAPAALGFALLAFGAFIVAIAGYGRAALGKPSQGVFGLTLGGDEGRLGWVVVLILILLFTVLGTAFLALAFMLAALALINVDAAQEPPEGFVNIFALFGAGEMAVAVALIAVFAAFSLWFGLRLSMAAPATLSAGRVQVLSVWPLSSKRIFEIAGTVLAAMAPGAGVLAVFVLVCDALTGASPAVAQSASGEAGALTVNAAVLVVIYALYGVGKMALLAAPAMAALCALYVKYASSAPVLDD